MKRRWNRTILPVLAGTLLVAGPVAGQVQRDIRNLRQNRRLATVPVQGKIHSLRPGILRVISDENQRWLVEVTRRTLVKVQGPSDVRVLQPGRFVRFPAEFDQRGTAQGAVTELTVFDPDEGIRPGIVEAAPDNPEEASARETQVGENGPRKTRRSPGRARSRSSRADRDARLRDQQQEPETQRLFVVGQIRGFREGVLRVQVGRGKAVDVSVDPSARIMIETKDYRVARAGDRIRLKGRFAGPGKLSARQIEIELAAPADSPSPAGSPESASETPPNPPHGGESTLRE